MCGGARAGGIPLLIVRGRGRFQQRTTAKVSSALAPLFAVALLTLSYTVLNYLAKTSNNWSQSVILVNTAAINSLSIGCVCVCVRACGSRLRCEGAKMCGGARAATGSEREGAKMCGGGRAGWIQFISLHGDGALTNGQGQTIPRGKIQN